MPLYGLPFILEKTLGQMIDDELLQSWTIHGKDNFTVVTIRFNMEATEDNTKDIRYKKAKPSQIKRDRERAERRTLEGSNNAHVESLENVDKKPSNSLNHIQENNTAGPNQGTDQSSGENGLTQAGGSNTSVLTSSGSEAAVTSNTSDGESTIDEDVGQVDIKCNECGECVNGENKCWFKCTMCNDYDICKECRDKGCHKYHNGQIQEFNEPANPANGYCNSCGLQFYPQRRTWFEVYNCSACEDYALCFKCKRIGRHHHHSARLSKITLGEYLKIIQ